MAIGEAHLAARYNRPGHELFHHFTYVLASDGDMMEGVQSEASSLAGHLGLGRLIVLYDNNHVTLSATTPIAFTEDVAARYRAYGWHVHRARRRQRPRRDRARDSKMPRVRRDRPSLISVQTVLGYGAPDKQGTFQAHGSPLGAEEVHKAQAEPRLARRAAVLHAGQRRSRHFRSAVDRGRELEDAWRTRLRRPMRGSSRARPRDSSADSPASSRGLGRRAARFSRRRKGLATRKASEAVMQAMARTRARSGRRLRRSRSLDVHVAQGGRATSSRPRARTQACRALVGGGWGYAGRNMHFGVREHAMAAAVNGLAYHGGFIPFGATFLVFSDYMRPSIRLAALAELHSIFVFTHDSIGVGEDGPSHEPIEHLASLRAIPNLLVIRPCDANETRWAWQMALEQRDRPTALVLTRQNVPTLDRTIYAPAELLRRGAYVLNPSRRAAGARRHSDREWLRGRAHRGRRADLAKGRRERATGLDAVVAPVRGADGRVSRERSARRGDSAARSGSGFAARLGTLDRAASGAIIGIDRFGASAPGATLFKEYGFTRRARRRAGARARPSLRSG